MALKVRNTLLIRYHCQRLFSTKIVLYFVTQILLLLCMEVSSCFTIICDINGFIRLSSDRC